MRVLMKSYQCCAAGHGTFIKNLV